MRSMTFTLVVVALFLAVAFSTAVVADDIVGAKAGEARAVEASSELSKRQYGGSYSAGPASFAVGPWSVLITVGAAMVSSIF